MAKQQQDGKTSKAQREEKQRAIINLLRHPGEKSRDRALAPIQLFVTETLETREFLFVMSFGESPRQEDSGVFDQLRDPTTR